MSARIYIEGGGKSNELRARCREGFRKLLEQCGFAGKMPRLVACGGRDAAFEGFKTAFANAAEGDYIAMWIDSEDPMSDIEKTWEHLKKRDGWEAPSGAHDDQVLMMVTCMETWIAADRPTLREHYRGCLQEAALPQLGDIESQSRDAVQTSLVRSTHKCKNRYTKGKESFKILAILNPVELQKYLPSFVRCKKILEKRL